MKYYEGGEKVKVVKLQILCRQYELLSMGEDEKVTKCVEGSKTRPSHEGLW